ncbi:Bug family tripartite tricarboxylate transporter substrate binding protein [Polaromonas sp. UC242_47]|uniref:Bug family tripartite tricarboxylate transporter substrate binding protein n=1 Tax=Polaromonas sp. UC242_47 TaxID=3374626 RepID=UPI0037AAC2BF
MIFHSLKLRIFAIAMLSFVAALSPAQAQKWPDKPIRLIVPAPAGGIADAVARLLAEQLRVNSGQIVLVDNKPGGSAVVAERALMSAPADGHTLMVGPSSMMTDIPLAVKKPYDPTKSFTYVAEAAGMVHVLVKNTSFPPNNIPELLEYAKLKPQSVSIASLSPGNRSDFLSEILREKSNNSMVVAPYKGSAPALTDLMGNHVQLTFDVVTNVVPFIQSGKLSALAVASATRSPHLPNVPSFGELGLPDLVMPDAGVGVFMLSSTPKPLGDQIQNELQKVINSSKFREALTAQGLDYPKNASIEQLRQRLEATTNHNKKIIEKLKLKISPN